MRYLTLALVLTVASASYAQGTVDLKFVGTGKGRTDLYLKFDDKQANVFAGQLFHEAKGGVGSLAYLSGKTVTTYCAEATEYVSRTFTDYAAVKPSGLAPSIWKTNGAAKDTAIDMLYRNAAGNQTKATVDKDYAAAFQLAVWKIGYDFNGSDSSLDFSSGRFKAGMTSTTGLNTTITGYLTQLFSGIGTSAFPANTSSVVGLTSDCAQDQLIEAVPEPASMAVLGGGALMMLRRRKQKKA